LYNLALVACGGAIGAILRYFSTNIFKFINPNFPLSTLFVNIAGSFFIGLLMSFLHNNETSQNFIKYFIVIGLLGSFTTFSTFSYEIIELFNNKKIILPTFYICISVSTCIFFCFIGYNINKI
tara:strand:- start:689 stop:1057 length:369 start_codon:yes stop_codon:yes gene_type:complete